VILINFDGKIKGDSQLDKHTDWVNITSAQLGVGRSISSSGSGKDRDLSTPSFSEVSISKHTDVASTELFAQAIYGKKLCEKAVIHFVQTSGEGASQVYMEWEMHEPIISSFSISSGGERPDETVTINFTKVLMKYSQFDSGGKQVQATPKGWDLKTGKPFNG